jgi:hypothetical protein
MRELLAIVMSGAAAVFAARGLWHLDQTILKCSTPVRAFTAASLAALSAGVGTLIVLAVVLRVPGGYGPVQFWGGTTPPFFAVRTCAMLVVLAGPIPCIISVLTLLVALFRQSSTPRFLRCLCPFIALAAFGLAYVLFNQFDFAPRV